MCTRSTAKCGVSAGGNCCRLDAADPESRNPQFLLNCPYVVHFRYVAATISVETISLAHGSLSHYHIAKRIYNTHNTMHAMCNHDYVRIGTAWYEQNLGMVFSKP